ncbi:MAG: hypothetical protein ACP5MD_12280, partial [Verrucomicrobiia bacterium]
MADASGLVRVSVAIWIITAGLATAANAASFPVATNPAITEIGGGVIFSGTSCLAGVVSGTNIAAQKISASGDREGVPIVIGSNPGFPPAAAFAAAATNALVAWSDRAVVTGVSAFGRICSAQNGAIGPAFPLLTSAAGCGFQEVKAAASDGTNFFVVWKDTASGTFYGQGVGGNGTLTGTKIALFSQADDAALRFGNTNYLVAWQTEDGNGNTHTYCRTVSPTGDVGSPTQISVTGSSDHNPVAVGFDGTNYLVVWNCTSGENELALYGRFVSQAGFPVGSELVLSVERAVFPTVAFDGANYLIVWSHQLPFPEHSLRARFFDTQGNPIGPVFSPCPPIGGSAPFFALNGLAYDGKRFVLIATHGDFILDGEGNVTGFAGGDVYGTFLPKSTTPPVFTNITVKNGFLQGQLSLVPGVTYTIELSTNLPVWTPAGLLSSDGTNILTIVDEQPCAENPQLFYRAAMGNRVPPHFDLSFIHFANGGRFEAGYSPVVQFPVEVGSYCVMLGVANDSVFPDPKSVFFTGPAGSSLVNAAAVPANSRVSTHWAQYQSPTVSTTSGAPGGTWTVNYKGKEVTLDKPDPQTRSHTVVPFPTVTINNGLIQSVSWVYKDATNGTTLPNAPSWVETVFVQVDSFLGGRVYNSPELDPNITSHVLTESINWSEVSSVYMAYDDSLGNH